jgi:hypothetical protein
LNNAIFRFPFLFPLLFPFRPSPGNRAPRVLLDPARELPGGPPGRRLRGRRLRRDGRACHQGGGIGGDARSHAGQEHQCQVAFLLGG